MQLWGVHSCHKWTKNQSYDSLHARFCVHGACRVCVCVCACRGVNSNSWAIIWSSLWWTCCGQGCWLILLKNGSVPWRLTWRFAQQARITVSFYQLSLAFCRVICCTKLVVLPPTTHPSHPTPQPYSTTTAHPNKWENYNEWECLLTGLQINQDAWPLQQRGSSGSVAMWWCGFNPLKTIPLPVQCLT